MRKLGVGAGSLLSPMLVAGALGWWLVSGEVLEEMRLGALAGVAVVLVVVYVAFDRGDRWKCLSVGTYSGAVLFGGWMTWLEVVRPVSDIGPVRFATGLLRLDVQEGLLVGGSVGALVLALVVWCEMAGRLMARKAEEKKKRARSEVFGKSKLLEREHVRRLERGSGLLLGQTGAAPRSPLIGWPLEGSAVTLAPPRSGKGATIALNYLAPGGRGWAGSTVLIDPRGETWCVVARRRREMGRRVVLLDPFGVVERHKDELEDELHLPDVRSRCYNPMQFIRADESLAPRDINVLLDAFLTPPSGSSDTSMHFYESARAIIGGYMAWVRFTEPPRRQTLQEVHRLLMLPPNEREEVVRSMRMAEGIGASMVRVAAERQTQVAAQEAGSNFSTIANQLSFLNYPELERHVSRSDFDPLELAHGDVDLFVVVPEEMTEHVKAWLRLWITIPNAVSGMKALQRDMLIVVDEMPKLGFLKPVMEGYNLAAGRGVHFWCFAQSVSAWDATWGRENRQILVDLAEVVQVLGFPRTDVDGAEALSAAIGWAGFENRSESVSGQAPGATMLPAGVPVQMSDSVATVRERVVTADEILTMGPDEQLVIAASKEVPRDAFRLSHARYWMRKDSKMLADPNPFVVRKRAAAVGGRYGMYARRREEASASV